MNYYKIITKYLKDYDISKGINLSIDTIRIDFNKETKLYKLAHIGSWHKVKPNTKISSKLKKRLADDEVTSAYQLGNHNIFYFNSKKSNYRASTMVIFGLKQYKGKEVPIHIITQILNVLNKINNIDICFDFDHKPNIDEVKKYYTLLDYKNYHQTYYSNSPNIPLIEKFYIYNKAFKNNLKEILWRIEFKVIIDNIKDLHLPLNEIKSIVALAQQRTINPKINAKGRNI